MFKTPILFLIFNRIETTQRVFDEIKKQKPKYLFVAADGGRPNVLSDIENCKATRDLVIKGIDWNCELKTLFRDDNLGCGIAVSKAISWFFDNVEQGIILEDDCLPHPSFFIFCETLLEYYKENDQIYGISGANFQNGIKRGDATYFFSNYFHIWGWASWKRAWKHYDFHLEQLEDFQKNNLIFKIDKRKIFENYWISIFKKTANKRIDTWDYQWLFSVWNKGGLIAYPNVNLISNIGFGEQATHTTEDSVFSNMSTKDIGVILHPEVIKVNKIADRYTSYIVYKIPNNSKLIYKFLKKMFKKMNLKMINL